MKIGKFLLTYLPTFCYQDFHEIVAMADKFSEELEDIYDRDSMSVSLANLVKTGKVEAIIPEIKRHGIGNNKRGFTYVYRRIG